jgi:hypothetical protein
MAVRVLVFARYAVLIEGWSALDLFISGSVSGARKRPGRQGRSAAVFCGLHGAEAMRNGSRNPPECQSRAAAQATFPERRDNRTERSRATALSRRLARTRVKE